MTTSRDGAAESDESAALSRLLDAFGQVLAAYAGGNIDLPGRSAVEVSEELERWRRHAVLGASPDLPRPESDDSEASVADEASDTSAGDVEQVAAVPAFGSITARNFGGAARVFADQRRAEKRLTESVLADLRDCLWTCVQRVHVAVEADLRADSATTQHIERLQSAIRGVETEAIRAELLDALKSMEDVARERRETQQSSFAQLAERIDVLSSELADARRESETDVLTGLGNRKRFDMAAARALQLATIGGAPVSLVLMDLDKLKDINDTLGHAAGDEALQAFAACMPRVFLGDADVLCRIGGDEFVALLPHASVTLAERLSFRLIQAVEATTLRADGRSLSVSVGYAQFERGEDLAGWMSRADAALYRCKSERAGRSES